MAKCQRHNGRVATMLKRKADNTPTPWQREKVEALHSAGKTTAEIARETSLSRQQVRAIIAGAGA